MKKFIIVLMVFILGFVSCKSDKEKQDEIKSNFLFDTSIASIKTSLFYTNIDSINSIFKEIKDPELKLKFAKQLNDYSIKLKSKSEKLSRNIEAIDKVNLKKIEVKEKEADKEWYSSKAGKIQKKYPGWSRKDCKSLADRKIWIGMTYEMLVYQRGKPNTVNPSNYGNGIHYQFCWDDYTPSCFYSEEDQIITSYN
jgi:hypothetical protein